MCDAQDGAEETDGRVAGHHLVVISLFDVAIRQLLMSFLHFGLSGLSGVRTLDSCFIGEAPA